MPEYVIRIEPRDPLTFRDARPFTRDPGAFAHTLDFPMPHTVAGAVRSHLIRHRQGFNGWSKEESDRARAIAFSGPLLLQTDNRIAWPAPADALVFETGPGEFTAVHLAPDSEGRNNVLRPEVRDSDLELTNLSPLKLLEPHRKKPIGRFRFWSERQTITWLFPTPGATQVPQAGGFPGLGRETRMHVGIDPERQAHRDGVLFGVEAIVFPQGWSLLARARTADASVEAGEPRFGPLGGERRVAAFGVHTPGWPKTPQPPTSGQTRQVKLHLVTPAIFDGGWLPARLGARLNALLGTTGRWTLNGVASNRPLAVTGWDYEHNRAKPLGYAVPAGSVYFLTAPESIDTGHLARQLWLAELSDSGNENGYGLALPGIW